MIDACVPGRILLEAADAQLRGQLTLAPRRAERATEMPPSEYQPSTSERVRNPGALPR
jgi:hypothetical protein